MDDEAIAEAIDSYMTQLSARAKPCLFCSWRMIGTTVVSRQKYCSPECRLAYYKEKKRAERQATA